MNRMDLIDSLSSRWFYWIPWSIRPLLNGVGHWSTPEQNGFDTALSIGSTGCHSTAAKWGWSLIELRSMNGMDLMAFRVCATNDCTGRPYRAEESSALREIMGLVAWMPSPGRGFRIGSFHPRIQTGHAPVANSRSEILY